MFGRKKKAMKKEELRKKILEKDKDVVKSFKKYGLNILVSLPKWYPRERYNLIKSTLSSESKLKKPKGKESLPSPPEPLNTQKVERYLSMSTEDTQEGHEEVEIEPIRKSKKHLSISREANRMLKGLKGVTGENYESNIIERLIREEFNRRDLKLKPYEKV